MLPIITSHHCRRPFKFSHTNFSSLSELKFNYFFNSHLTTHCSLFSHVAFFFFKIYASMKCSKLLVRIKGKYLRAPPIKRAPMCANVRQFFFDQELFCARKSSFVNEWIFLSAYERFCALMCSKHESSMCAEIFPLDSNTTHA